MRALISIFLISIVSAVALAAPTPLGSSSFILAEKPNIYRSPLGFSLHTEGVRWSATEARAKSDFIVAAFTKDTDTTNVRGAFTVRVDSIKKDQDLDSYVKKWIKDYPRLGFEVLTSKKVNVNGEVGFLLDLVNRDNKMQLRQLLFIKNQNVVNLSCRDQLKDFTDTLKDCNQIFRNFSWN